MNRAFIKSSAPRSRRSKTGRLWVAGIGLLLVGFASLSCARKPVKLRWKLEEGKTYVYRSEFTGVWKIEGGEMDGRGGEYGNLTMTEMNVTAVEDSAFKIHETTELIREGQEFTPIIVEYRLTPAGRLYGIELLDAGNIPRSFTSPKRRERFFDQTQPTYPDRELKPGEHWVQETKVVLDDRVLTATSEFSVKDWEKVEGYMCLRIDYAGSSIVPHKQGEAELLDKGAAEGSIWFAPEEGLLVQQRDSFHIATTRVMPEGEAWPATYVVDYVRIYQLVEIR